WNGVAASQGAAGRRGSRARWPDLTQTLQPLRPAVACSVAPAGNLSHESRVNSSPPSIRPPISSSLSDGSAAEEPVVCMTLRWRKGDSNLRSPRRDCDHRRPSPGLSIAPTADSETLLPRPAGERQDRALACDIFSSASGREGRNDARRLYDRWPRAG